MKELLLNWLNARGFDVTLETFETEAFKSAQLVDYDFDSLDLVDFLWTVEDELNVDISDEIEETSTFSELFAAYEKAIT
jgi:acyl carrier protein